MPKQLAPISPGEILLEEFLIPLGISQNRLARELAVPVARVSEIVHGHRGISADSALRLARFFGTTPEFWINLQARYDLKRAREALGPELAKTIKPLKAA